MDFEFEVGHKYRRRDVYRIIGVDENTHGGNWDTGYNRLGRDWFIFCNIGGPGRTGHDYENKWIGDRLQWFGKTHSKSSHPSIQQIVGTNGDTYIFYRSDNQEAFTFAGCGTAETMEDTVPVKVIWKFDSVH